MSRVRAIRTWVKTADHPLATVARALYRAQRGFEMPLIRPLHAALYGMHQAASGLLRWCLRVFYWTPLFRSQLRVCGRHLYLYGGMPQILGGVAIDIGDDCRLSGQTTIAGRAGGAALPWLSIGRNVDIGWQTSIAVGRRVHLGDDVRIAGRAHLAGYPGHPLEPRARALGLPETEDQVDDIILEDGVWLGSNTTVLAGVTIGRGSVIGAGSVVTRDVPPGVLAAGVPAKVLRPLPGCALEQAS